MNFSFFSRKKDVVNATTNTSNSTNTTADANRSSNPNISILEAFKEFGNQSGVTLHWSDEEDDEEEDDDDYDDIYDNKHTTTTTTTSTSNDHSSNNNTNSIKNTKRKGSPKKSQKFNIPDNEISLTAKHQVPITTTTSTTTTTNSTTTINTQVMAEQMKKKVREFTTENNLRIFCGTWNVSSNTLEYDDDDDSTSTSNDNSSSNNIKEESSIRTWLIPQDQPLCDIYAVGFQEICELSAVNVVLDGSKSVERALYWKRKILLALSNNNDSNDDSNNYTMISENHLVGTALFVFVKKELLPKVSDLRTVTCGIGLLGFGGNKGAVTTRIVVDETSITFVTSHLRAGAEKLHGRNTDIKSILAKTLLTQNANNVLSDNLLRPSRQYINSDLIKDLEIRDSDYVFWFGDLNYRLDETNLNTDDIWHDIITGHYKDYLQHDQLSLEREKGQVFQGFEEGTITFKPSYKFIPGTDLYDDRLNGKLKTPAWCDRILWRNNNQFNKIHQDYYNIALLHNSDHKPVGSIFTCTVREANIEQERKVFQEVLQTMDKWENDATPKLLLEGQILDFGKVAYNNIYEKDVKIKNVGRTLASWQLCPGPMSDSFSKPWLYFSMEEGVLIPGDEEILKVVIEIDETNINSFPTDVTEVNIEEVVIVRALNGGDFFCMIIAVVDLSYIKQTNESTKDLCFGDIYDKSGHFEVINPIETPTSSSSSSTTSSPPNGNITMTLTPMKPTSISIAETPIVDFADVYDTPDTAITDNPYRK